MRPFSAFNKSILKFTKPSSNSLFNCHSLNGIKLITRLTLRLSHLCQHKFWHNFQDTLNPTCSFGDDSNTAIHYSHHCPNYLDERRTLLRNIESTGQNIYDNNDSQSQSCLYLVFLQAMMQQINVFDPIYCLLKDLASLLLTLESFEKFIFLNTYANTRVSNNSSHKI